VEAAVIAVRSAGALAPDSGDPGTVLTKTAATMAATETSLPRQEVEWELIVYTHAVRRPTLRSGVQTDAAGPA
jgi:hypothetical protein